MRIVHEGRGGFVEIEGVRYPIEHIAEGRFAIHFAGRKGDASREAHLRELEALVAKEPDRWSIERR